MITLKTEEGYDIHVVPEKIQAIIVMKENRCKVILDGYIANVVAPIAHILEQLENSD